MIIRKAVLNDAQQIFTLVNLGEREGQLLPRSLDSIRASLGNWIVIEHQGHIIGCGSLLGMGPTLCEVRSLAVAPGFRKHGLGGKLVTALLEEARARRVPTVFALTRAVSFFEKLGFQPTVKEDFPEKVWRDCVVCPVRNACDEVAVVYPIESAQWAVQIPVLKSQILNLKS